MRSDFEVKFKVNFKPYFLPWLKLMVVWSPKWPASIVDSARIESDFPEFDCWANSSKAFKCYHNLNKNFFKLIAILNIASFS